MQVLNVDVPPGLPQHWVTWLAPGSQPFFLAGRQAAEWGLTVGQWPADPQLRDTYEMYGEPDRTCVAWLDEPSFLALPGPVRAGLVRAQVEHGRAAVPTVRAWTRLLGPGIREQAGGHRFVWWPSLLSGTAGPVLGRLLAEDLPPSRHALVSEQAWAGAAALLPGARALAGTFPHGSGPNCFGTVMAAAGVPGAAGTWMQREPFEEWLAALTTRGGRDDVPGTVLVWRAAQNGQLQHAAVTLGDGWALNKRSQSWQSPRTILSAAEVIATSRTPGWHLSRYSITSGKIISQEHR